MKPQLQYLGNECSTILKQSITDEEKVDMTRLTTSRDAKSFALGVVVVRVLRRIRTFDSTTTTTLSHITVSSTSNPLRAHRKSMPAGLRPEAERVSGRKSSRRRKDITYRRTVDLYFISRRKGLFEVLLYILENGRQILIEIIIMLWLTLPFRCPWGGACRRRKSLSHQHYRREEQSSRCVCCSRSYY